MNRAPELAGCVSYPALFAIACALGVYAGINFFPTLVLATLVIVEFVQGVLA